MYEFNVIIKKKTEKKQKLFSLYIKKHDIIYIFFNQKNLQHLWYNRY